MAATVTIDGVDVPSSNILEVSESDLDDFEAAFAIEDEEPDEPPQQKEKAKSRGRSVSPPPSRRRLAKARRKPRIDDKRKSGKESRTQSDGSKYAAQSEPRGVDFRGIPYKEHLGIMMPDYDRIDSQTRRLLRLELEARQKAVAGAYEDLQFRQYDSSSPDKLTLMHYEYYTKNKLAEARTNAITWQQSIISFSSFIEVTGSALGYPLQDMTSANARVLPFTQSIVLDLARQEGSPLPSLLSPKVQLLGLFVVNGLFFVLCKSIRLPKATTESDTYNQLTGILGDAYRHFVPSTNAHAPTTGVGTDSPYAQPAVSTDAAPANGMGGLMQGLSSLAGTFMRNIQSGSASDTANTPASADTPTRSSGSTGTAPGRRRRRAAAVH